MCRLEQLHRISRWILGENLLSTLSNDNLVAEGDIFGFEASNSALEIVHR